LDATDSRCCAPLPYPFQPPRLFRREQFMPVIHRTHVRISRIGASLPSRIRHPHFRFGTNVRVTLAQRDGIAITLRHLPPVEPRYPRRLLSASTPALQGFEYRGRTLRESHVLYRSFRTKSSVRTVGPLSLGNLACR